MVSGHRRLVAGGILVAILLAAIVLVPYVMPVVSAVLVWETLLNPQFGPLNVFVLGDLGGDVPIAFLSERRHTFGVLGIHLTVPLALLTAPDPHDLRGLRDLELDPVGGLDRDRVGVADAQLEGLARQLRAIADALDLQAALVTVGDALDHVRDQAAGEAVDGPVGTAIGGTLDRGVAVLLDDLDLPTLTRHPGYGVRRPGRPPRARRESRCMS